MVQRVYLRTVIYNQEMVVPRTGPSLVQSLEFEFGFLYMLYLAFFVYLVLFENLVQFSTSFT